MFLNKIKDFFIKKTFKRSLSNVPLTDSNGPVKTIGIVFNEGYFSEKEALIKELVFKGILPENIQFLAFRNSVKKNETFDYPVFSYEDISWSGNFQSQAINDFVNTKFDLLISYYDVEKGILIALTHLSKTSFKVGFSSIDSRLNHFMIDTKAENYIIFTDELFKYLKILNKL